MMSITHLKTLLTIRNTGSFLEASTALNLSHSAISVQMKQLEQRLGRDVFIKGRRPAQFTSFGDKFCTLAGPVVADYDRLMRTSVGDSIEGLVRIGFVSTTFQTLLPIVLDTLRHAYDQLEVNAVSGLSDELAGRVEREELDFAFVSAPTETAGNLRLVEYARESLHIVAPLGLDIPDNPLELLETRPFIGFAGSSWLGAQIHAALREIGVRVKQIVELDSIDAIEALVTNGAGVSVVPQRLFAGDLGQRMQCLDFPVRNNQRILSLIYHRENDRARILKTLIDIPRKTNVSARS
jgi:DNA-binding transcriptional LysR family regulator